MQEKKTRISGDHHPGLVNDSTELAFGIDQADEENHVAFDDDFTDFVWIIFAVKVPSRSVGCPDLFPKTIPC
ncbi:hypothetical protein [Methanogenium sp. MK-MG]|uniref:hypothetical protein n=1 Tax=Methanogenium sp. MK-MG TaxID=2599926 RepID=UPI0013ED7315|nr:hypothetical protein [Methanogenium sp. MK-MG]